MYNVRKAATAGVLMVGAVLGSTLYASPSEDHGKAATALSTAAPADPSALSAQELEARASAMATRVHTHVRATKLVAAVALADHDQLKLGCLDQSLATSTQILKVSDDAFTTLQASVRSGNRAQQLASFKRVADASAQCDDTVAGSCAGVKEVAVVPVAVSGRSVTVTHPRMIDDPTTGCGILGIQDCQFGAIGSQLEYVAYASPFTPD